MNKSLKFYVPNSLLLEDIIKLKYPRFIKHLDKFYYIIHKIFITRFLDHRYKDCSEITKKCRKKIFVPLNATILKNLLGSHLYIQIIRILVENNFIEQNSSYSVGKKSKSYRITNQYLTSKYRLHYCTDGRLIKKLTLDKLNKSKQDGDLRRIHSMLFNQFYFDSTNAKYYLDRLIDIDDEHRYVYQLQLDIIQNKDWYLTQSDCTGRVFHNYTNVKKEFRQFIKHISGEKLFEIDIANCQPFLLGSLIKDYSDAEDVQRYVKIVCDGQYYQYMSDKYDYNIETIKQKTMIMLFYNGKYEIDLLEEFKQEFPTIFKAIDMIKQDSYKDISVLLQQLESQLMIENVAEQLLNEGIEFIPIHDSVIVPESKVDRATEIIKDNCQRLFGLIPTIKIK